MFVRESGTLTDYNEAANELDARRRERAKYHFPSSDEYRNRIAACFLEGTYVLPYKLDRSNGNNDKEVADGAGGGGPSPSAALTSKQNADCQTEDVATRDVGLGDGDVDALPPERTLDIPTDLPDVAEFPILSLPQQLEAERRLQGLLARVEEEIKRVAEEARREAQKNNAKDPHGGQSLGGSGGFMSTDEWNVRMASAVTNRLRGKHQKFDEDLALSQGAYLQTFVRQHKIGLKAEQHRGAHRGDGSGSSSPSSSATSYPAKYVEIREEPALISQTITPAVQHVLKMRPMLTSRVRINQHLDDSENSLPPNADITNPGVISSLAAQRKSEAARPLTRGLRIALSKQRFYTVKPGQRDGSPPGMGMGQKSASSGAGGDFHQDPLDASVAQLRDSFSGSPRGFDGSASTSQMPRRRNTSTPRSGPSDSATGYIPPKSLRDSQGVASPRRF